MEVLVVDAASELDAATLQMLYLRGYSVQVARTGAEALRLLADTSFDCVIVGIPHSAEGKHLGLSEIRGLIRTSAVALMTSVPVEVVIDRALQDGSIEIQPSRHWIARLRDHPERVLVVAPELDPEWERAIREEGRVAVSASTLTFLVKLLDEDRTRGVILLEADIPGRLEGGSVVIFCRITAHLLAVLASAVSAMPSGIVHTLRPEGLGEYIDLFERTAANRLSHCGLAARGGSLEGRAHGSCESQTRKESGTDALSS